MSAFLEIHQIQILNASKLMYFDRNINVNKDDKILGGNY